MASKEELSSSSEELESSINRLRLESIQPEEERPRLGELGKEFPTLQSRFVPGVHRDPVRWPETTGWPPIVGGSEDTSEQAPGGTCPEGRGETRGQSSPESIADTQDERLANALHDIQRGYDPGAHFETQLMLEGLLDRLERARIVPVVENPNPYDPGIDEDKHEQWWEDHPSEGATFERDVDRRNEILRFLYIGAIIGSGPWNLP